MLPSLLGCAGRALGRVASRPRFYALSQSGADGGGLARLPVVPFDKTKLNSITLTGNVGIVERKAIRDTTKTSLRVAYNERARVGQPPPETIWCAMYSRQQRRSTERCDATTAASTEGRFLLTAFLTPHRFNVEAWGELAEQARGQRRYFDVSYFFLRSFIPGCGGGSEGNESGGVGAAGRVSVRQAVFSSTFCTHFQLTCLIVDGLTQPASSPARRSTSEPFRSRCWSPCLSACPSERSGKSPRKQRLRPCLLRRRLLHLLLMSRRPARLRLLHSPTSLRRNQPGLSMRSRRGRPIKPTRQSPRI